MSEFVKITRKSKLTVSKPVSSTGTEEQAKSSASSDYFSTLPDEIIFKIFRGLSKKELKHCSAVCLRWRKISSDRLLGLWSQVSIQHETITLARLTELLQSGTRTLKLLCITVVDSDASGGFFTPPNYDSWLEDLTAIRPNISALGLASIIECTSHLVKLDISRCTLGQRIVNAISKNTELRLLRLNGCQNLNKMDLTTILKGCQKIERLGLCGTKLSTEAIDTMIPLLSASLSHLDMRHCGPNLIDKHLRAIAETCPHLTKLEIMGNTGLS